MIGKCHKATECVQCQQPCPTICEHSQCKKQCSVACASCCEPCTWSCEHQGRCPLPCGAPCNRLPCNMICTKVLSCGHPCPGVCGELCPSPLTSCKYCAEPVYLNQSIDVIEGKTLAEYDCDKPLITLSCNHTYTIESLDGMMNMNDYYIIDELTSNYIELKPLPTDAKPRAKCMICRQPISNVHRYGRVLNDVALELAAKKFDVDFDIRLHKEQKKYDTVQHHIQQADKQSNYNIKSIQQIINASEQLYWRINKLHPYTQVYEQTYSMLSATIHNANKLKTALIYVHNHTSDTTKQIKALLHCVNCYVAKLRIDIMLVTNSDKTNTDNNDQQLQQLYPQLKQQHNAICDRYTAIIQLCTVSNSIRSLQRTYCRYVQSVSMIMIGWVKLRVTKHLSISKLDIQTDLHNMYQLMQQQYNLINDNDSNKQQLIHC